MYLTEDQVRDQARILLNFYDDENAKSGVGQQTTFNVLDKSYWGGISDKPDGWYLPNDKDKTAIVLETKASNKNLEKEKSQIMRYIEIAHQKYQKVVGIIYNGESVLVYNDKLQQIRNVKENTLLPKDYYIDLVNREPIDIASIQVCTIRINELLHHKFVMQDLKHRMIFTACALVAHKKGANLESFKNLSFTMLKNRIIEILEKSYSDEKRTNDKLNIIKEQYEKITCDKDDDIKAIGDFIDNVIKISQYIGSNK